MKPNWTLQVILSEDTDYNQASTFLDELASDIKKRLRKESMSGLVIAKTIQSKRTITKVEDK